jgi:hypothetical protein
MNAPVSHPRVRAAGLHLLLSAVVAALVSLLVFKLWYPSPFATLAGGVQLFVLLVSVDVVMGPALTAVAASPGKPRRELVRDLACIVALQLAAFGYGLYVTALSRPIGLVFEINEFRLITATDVFEPETLAQAPPGLRDLSWQGPRLMAVVKPTDPQEFIRSVELGMAGVPLAAMPRYWRDYAAHAAATWDAARPVSALLAKYPSSKEAVARAAAAAGEQVSALRFLPLRARQAEWVALVAGPQARIVGYLPFDGYL